MTDVYLDETRLELGGVSPASTVGDVVEAVEADLKPFRRFVQELWVDGTNKGESWMEAVAINEPVEMFDEVKLFTGDIAPLILRGICTVSEYIEFISELIEQTSKILRRGGVDVDKRLGAIIESTGEVIKTMDSLYRSGISYDIDIFRENPIESYEAILKSISGLRDARISCDYALLADMLEHELAPTLTEMEEKVFHRKDM